MMMLYLTYKTYFYPLCPPPFWAFTWEARKLLRQQEIRLKKFGYYSDVQVTRKPGARSWRLLCVKKGSWSLSLQNEQLAAAFAQGWDKMGYVLCIDPSLKLFDQEDGSWMELEGRWYQVREGLWFYLVGWDWSMCIGTENKEKNRDRDKDRDRHRCMHAKSLQSCLTLCDPMDRSLPGSSVHGFSRKEYWSGLPCPSPRGSSQPKNQTQVFCDFYTASKFFTHRATWEAQRDREWLTPEVMGQG